MKTRTQTAFWILAGSLFILLIWNAIFHEEAYSGHRQGYLALWSIGLTMCLALPTFFEKWQSVGREQMSRLPVSFLASIGFAAFAADQLIKWLVMSFVKGSPKVILIPSIFSITHATNPGAILGILPGHRAVFIASGIITTLVVFFYYRFVGVDEKLTQLCLSLVLAGALANMTDRIFLGHVIDMFEVSWQSQSLTIFNLADLFIDGGVLLIVLDVFINGMRVPEEN